MKVMRTPLSLAGLALAAVFQADALAQAPEPSAPAEAPAPPSQAQGPRWQWSTSAGVNHYREPSQAMRLRGPELGVHLRLSDFPAWPGWQLEGDVLAGLQRYDSPNGRLDKVENLETRWRLLYPLWPREGGGLFAGPAVHTLYNDLRGQTSLGAAGYQRESLGLWLAAQWRQPLHLLQGPSALSGLQLDAGRLVRGRHNSYLSQANRSFPDIGNTQRHGWYAQARLDLQAERMLLQPFVRYTHLKSSEESVEGLVRGVEPASRRWQVGLQVSWPPR